MAKLAEGQEMMSRINITVTNAEIAYLRAKQREGYGISQFIRYLLEQAEQKDKARKAILEENKLN